jgi:hypothetical protein
MEKKIGFVVEGSVDKALVEALAPRIFGAGFEVQAIRIGGAIALRWAYSTVLTLLEEKHCHHVILLLDAGAQEPSQIDRRKQQIVAMLEEHRLGSDDVSVCLAVPEIEAWLLAAYEERREERREPKAALLEHLGARRMLPDQAAEIARTLDIEKARTRSPSFDAFVRTLGGVAARFAQAPAA